MERLFLVGLMGAGKSTVGRRCAERLEIEYVDNDTEFARLAGESTTAFASHGPAALHAIEAEYVRQLLGRQGPFVAGLPASVADQPDLAAEVRVAGFAVYLRARADTLAARTRVDPRRPWLDGDSSQTLESMFEARDVAFQAMADVVIDVDELTTDFITDEIVRAVASL